MEIGELEAVSYTIILLRESLAEQVDARSIIVLQNLIKFWEKRKVELCDVIEAVTVDANVSV